MNTSNPDEIIHIAIGFDQHYIIHIYPMLASVFDNNKTERIVFHVIPSGISDLQRTELAAYIRTNNAEIIFHTLSDALLNEKVTMPENSYFTIATFFRLFFPSLIDPSIKKLLYLDPDIIVLGNLRELYLTDIGNLPVAAVTDPYMEEREELGIHSKGAYFNAGVMLIDTNNWKQQQVSENALRFAKDNPAKVKYLDQDALNATLAGNWFRLQNRYNLTQFDVHLQVPAKELIKDVLIVHFTSYNKPWNALTRNKLRYLYHHYLKLSPKKNEKKYTDFKWDLKSMWTFARIRIKEFYFNHKINTVMPIKKWEAPSWNY